MEQRRLFRCVQLLSVGLCIAFLSGKALALPCDKRDKETCVEAKRPTTVIREQNNSPCYGCQAPDPGPAPLPSSQDDGTFRTNPKDADLCRMIANAKDVAARATENANVARSQIPAQERDIAGYDAEIEVQEGKVAAARAKIPGGAATTGGSIVKCTAKMRELDNCPDYDPSAAGGAISAYRTETTRLERLKEARQSVQSSLERNRQAIKDEVTARAKRDRLEKMDTEKSCRR